MSDPEVPRSPQADDVNDVVDRANAGLDAAAAAAAEVPASDAQTVTADDAATAQASVVETHDPDLAAFDEAERSHPGTFAQAPPPASVEPPAADSPRQEDADAADTNVSDRPGLPDTAEESRDSAWSRSGGASTEDEPSEVIAAAAAASAAAGAAASSKPVDSDADRASDLDKTSVYEPPASDAQTQIVSEPVAPAAAPQPIFVQAPEPPRERGNRATAGVIGLLAAIVFAVLYLGVTLGLGAIGGDVRTDQLGQAALAPLTTWGFWTPVAAFFLGFWFLGAIINRGRWGFWVVFGLLVGLFAYAGYILGQLIEAPFWGVSASQATGIVNDQLYAPLALAAFVLGRELTVWFGAWVARSGARKTELNEEAQREYERTLEAGPSLPR